jgi:serine/threonine-protein kinase
MGGAVADQRPGQNARVRRGGTVTLVLSKGPDRRVVPKLVGSTLPIAEATLKNLGLRTGTITKRFSSYASGLVIATDPAAGKALRENTLVNLVVSMGREQLDVPKVVGKPRDEAVRIINGAGFKADVIEVFSDTVAAGTVADQSPSIGKASRDSTITLQVSKGPELVQVPDLNNVERDAAVAQLEALGLTAHITRFGGGKKVHAQNPSAGTMVRKGTVVDLLVY